jgi:hypothetical protein
MIIVLFTVLKYFLSRFTTLCDDLMECMLRLDGNLHAELNADIQKELNMELNRAKTSQKEKKDNDIVKVINCF